MENFLTAYRDIFELVVNTEVKKKRGKDKRTKDLSAVCDHNSL